MGQVLHAIPGRGIEAVSWTMETLLDHLWGLGWEDAIRDWNAMVAVKLLGFVCNRYVTCYADTPRGKGMAKRAFQRDVGLMIKRKYMAVLIVPGGGSRAATKTAKVVSLLSLELPPNLELGGVNSKRGDITPAQSIIKKMRAHPRFPLGDRVEEYIQSHEEIMGQQVGFLAQGFKVCNTLALLTVQNRQHKYNVLSKVVVGQEGQDQGQGE